MGTTWGHGAKVRVKMVAGGQSGGETRKIGRKALRVYQIGDWVNLQNLCAVCGLIRCRTEAARW